jgi:hypothetical protein
MPESIRICGELYAPAERITSRSARKVSSWLPYLDMVTPTARDPSSSTRVTSTPVKTCLPPEIYAYRAGRNAQQAAVEVEELLFRGHPEVVDADLADYLEAASYCPPAYEVTSNSVG